MTRKLFQIFEKLIEHKITFVFQYQGQEFYNIGLEVPDDYEKATKQKSVYFNSPDIKDIEKAAVEMYGHLLNEKSPKLGEWIGEAPILTAELGHVRNKLSLPTMPLPPGM